METIAIVRRILSGEAESLKGDLRAAMTAHITEAHKLIERRALDNIEELYSTLSKMALQIDEESARRILGFILAYRAKVRVVLDALLCLIDEPNSEDAES